MMKIRFGGVIMEDSFEKLANIIKENNLCSQALDYLVEIKKALEEKEKIEEAFETACKELEDKDSTLFDLYESLDYYYETYAQALEASGLAYEETILGQATNTKSLQEVMETFGHASIEMTD